MKKNNQNLIFFMPFIGIGGVEKNLFNIANFFSNKISNIYICTSSTKYKKKFNNKIKFISPKIRINENLNIRIKYIICLFLLVRLFLKSRDYVVLSFQANIYCILICKIFGIKILIRSNSSPEGWYHNKLKKILYKKIVSLADEVIVNSKDFKKQMDKKFNLNTKCIYNPLDQINIKKKSKLLLKKNIFKKDTLKIINIGRITDQKDQITIIKAINEIKNKIKLQLIIIGRGEKKKFLLENIKMFKLQKIIKIISPSDKTYKYLNSSELFILSSKYEGLPNVLLEAIVLKKFVISSNCPTGPREILLNGKGGLLFEIGNYKKLGEQIIFFSKNKEKCKKKLDISFQSLKRFDFRFNLNKYLQLTQKYLVTTDK